MNNKLLKASIIGCLLLFVVVSCSQGSKKTTLEAEKTQKLKDSDSLEVLYKQNLKLAVVYIDSLLLKDNREQMLNFYQKSRMYFKRAEPVLWAVDKNNYLSLNGPNILKVDEEDLTAIKIKKPIGYQVLEESLFEETIDVEAIKKVAEKTRNRLRLIHHNTRLKLKEHHILWLIRDAIIRIATMGITGFDSPAQLASLKESQIVYDELLQILKLYRNQFQDQKLLAQWQKSIKASKTSLEADFDNFDRYSFIKNHVNGQLRLWVKTTEEWNVEFPFTMAINHDASQLFSSDFLNTSFFADYRDTVDNPLKIELGKKLFHDPILSANNKMSCATCHQEEKAFTDGLVVFPGQKRNTPTLYYAGLQQGFFFDKRSGSLEGQIVSVAQNENEFHTNLSNMVDAVKDEDRYKPFFDSIYHGELDDYNVRNAIASYIRSLNPFNSRFDRSINGLEKSLTAQEIEGFNLFMGKASCATCHFPPTFNGTVPPNFKESELENLGVPETSENKQVDDDLGRFYVFETQERKHFFKTPTVRNISKTAPYMHNGVYESLEQVMEFYNRGGGAGMGFDLPLQTLPADSLHLSNHEIKSIIAFMQSLNDNEAYKL